MSGVQNLVDFVRHAADSGQLSYLNHANLSQANEEFIRNDVWDLNIVAPAAVGYYPGNEIIKARLQSVTFTIDGSLTQLEKTVRGWKFHQSVRQGAQNSGTITLKFVDRVDLKIHRWLDQWRQAFGDDKNRYAFSLAECIMPAITLTQMTTNRTVLKKYQFFVLQPTNLSHQSLVTDQFGAEASADSNDVTLVLSYDNMLEGWNDSKLGANPLFDSILPKIG